MSRTNGGKRADLGGIYFRSSWEANWARYLNFRKAHGDIVKWEYEPDTFEFVGIKRGTRFYKPDFKVYYPLDVVQYEEVKGYMDAKSKTMLKRMAKYHPDVVVHVVDRARYQAVAKRLSHILAGWEHPKTKAVSMTP